MYFVPRVLSSTAFRRGSSNLMVAAPWYTISTSSQIIFLSSTDIPRFGSVTSPLMGSTREITPVPRVDLSKSKSCKIKLIINLMKNILKHNFKLLFSSCLISSGVPRGPPPPPKGDSSIIFWALPWKKLFNYLGLKLFDLK